MPAGDSESSRPLLRDEDDRNVVRPTRPAIYQLEVFLKVVETRSFAATARQLGRTQPAVSQVIARLEDLYGGDLFERRRGSPVSLTPIGEAILPSARMLLHTLDHHMARAAQTAQSRTGSLGIGQTISFESATVPRPGIAFRPILDENAFATIEAAWPKEDRNPIRHRLLNCVRKHGRNLG